MRCITRVGEPPILSPVSSRSAILSPAISLARMVPDWGRRRVVSLRRLVPARQRLERRHVGFCFNGCVAAPGSSTSSSATMAIAVVHDTYLKTTSAPTARLAVTSASGVFEPGET